MTASELKAAGERLYGPKWQQPLARELKLSADTIRRWETDARPVPGYIAEMIGRLIKERTTT